MPSRSDHPPYSIFILLASLYCAQGLPSGLIAYALPVLLRQQGAPLVLVGLLKLLALPWLLKALWAPWIDRLASPRLGRHRGWILPLQTLVIGAVALLALLDAESLFSRHLGLLFALLLLINAAAATQDVASDGLTVRLLRGRWLGLGNSLQVGAYKVGMIVSGSGLLLLIDGLGWHLGVELVALLLVVTTLPVLFFAEKRLLPVQPKSAAPAGFSLLWQHYRGLLAQPGMGLWLLVVLTFKLGDALGTPMLKPMLVDQGWSNAALGSLTLVSSLAGIGGALLGGLLYARLGAKKSLLCFGVLQALGIAAFAWLLGHGGEVGLVYGVALFEQVADGMSTVALFAAMMARCRAGYEGGDYTLQASVQVLLDGLVGSASGLLAQALGYGVLFLGAGALGLGVLALVWQYYRQVQQSD